MIEELIRRKGSNQRKFALEIGVTPQSVNAWVKGKKRIDQENLPIVAKALGVTVDELLGNEMPNATAIESPQFIELPYISVPARASFIELASSEQDFGYPDTYRVIVEHSSSYSGQIIIEVDGDSMEPYYPTGTKVRCKSVPQGDWQYINSGVYAVSYANNFVIKRIRNNDYQAGYLMLHSDNTETGGTSPAPIELIHHIWKVLRIVDAPAR